MANVVFGYTPIDISVLPDWFDVQLLYCGIYAIMPYSPSDIIGRNIPVSLQTLDIKISSNGRMVLPASVRKAMGLHGDTKVILTIEDDQVRLSPIGHGVSRAQALYREHARHARTTDDFLHDRKVEAAADLREIAPSEADRDA